MSRIENLTRAVWIQVCIINQSTIVLLLQYTLNVCWTYAFILKQPKTAFSSSGWTCWQGQRLQFYSYLTSHSLSHEWVAKIKTDFPLKLTRHRDEHFLFSWLKLSLITKQLQLNHSTSNLSTSPYKKSKAKLSCQVLWSLDLKFFITIAWIKSISYLFNFCLW